jgi:hypothetical protein
MKVQYTKQFTDEHGDTFQSGWVAEHTDAEAARRIAKGVCVEVDKEARSRRQALSGAPSVECVPEQKESGSIFGLKNNKTNTNK